MMHSWSMMNGKGKLEKSRVLSTVVSICFVFPARPYYFGRATRQTSRIRGSLNKLPQEPEAQEIA
jgi:hypothetical protein